MNRMSEINDFAVNLKMVLTKSSIKNHSEERKMPQEINMCDLVDSKTRVTLLSGVAGVGKSVLAKRIVYSWAMEELYKDFALCLYFECRKLNESIRFTDAAARNQELQRFIRENMPGCDIPEGGDGVLIVIDGVDELFDIKQENSIIYEFLDMSKLFINSTILITGRPDTEHLFNVNNINIGEYKVMEIQGLYSKDQNKYIENFSKCTNRDNPGEIRELIMKTISSSNNIYPLLSVPQFLSTICCVSVLTQGEQVTSDVELYTWTLCFLLQHDFEKTPKVNKSKIIDIVSRYKEALLLFSRISFDLYRKKMIIFKKEDFQTEFSKLKEGDNYFFSGLFMEVPDNFHDKFEFKHLTLMQFMASIYVCTSSCFKELIEGKSFEVIEYALGLFRECLCDGDDDKPIIRCMFKGILGGNIKETAQSFFLGVANLLHSFDEQISRSIELVRFLPKNIKDKKFVQNIFSNLKCTAFCPSAEDLKSMVELYHYLESVGCNEQEAKSIFANIDISLLEIHGKKFLEAVKYFKSITLLYCRNIDLTANDVEFMDRIFFYCKNVLIMSSAIECVENTRRETLGWTLEKLVFIKHTLKGCCMNTIARWGASSKKFLLVAKEYPEDWQKVFLTESRLRKKEGSLTLKQLMIRERGENQTCSFNKEVGILSSFLVLSSLSKFAKSHKMRNISALLQFRSCRKEAAVIIALLLPRIVYPVLKYPCWLIYGILLTVPWY